MAQKICLPFVVKDIPDPGSREFCIGEQENERQGFIVHKNGQVYAYHNQCPHTGVPLNWSEHVFLDSEDELIQCAMHGALFMIETGYCLRGPCLGNSLHKISLTVDAKGQIFAEIN